MALIFQNWGVNVAQRNLSLAGTEGTIIREDVFAFAKAHRVTFDFVYSMGLIEHFSTPHAILEEMYSLLKPGGTMLTVTPNLRGIYTADRARRESETPRNTHGNSTRRTGNSAARNWISCYRIWVHRRSLKLSVVDYSPLAGSHR